MAYRLLISKLNLLKNEITSIIGPNGAGKTTFFDLIRDFKMQIVEKYFFERKRYFKSQPYKIARMGMVRTFQLTKVFDRMTVMENLLFSGSSVKNDSFLRSFLKLNSQKKYMKRVIRKKLMK